MKFNLQCNTNCHDHIDYRFPLTPEKSDLRTTYNVCNDYFYPIPQNFDCRVKSKPKLNLLTTDIRIKEEKRSLYSKDYAFLPKQEDAMLKYDANRQRTDMRPFQERLNRNQPPSVPQRLSEMKDSYGMPPWSATRDALTPAMESHCEISGLANALQPAIPPERSGYFKYLDIYMSQNSLDFRPYSETNFLASRKDLPTSYNILGTYPKSKYLLGDPPTGNKEMYDKPLMRPQYPNKNLSKGWKRVPHRGMQSESSGSYTTQSFSDVFPYLYDIGVTFSCPSSDDCGPWQIYSIPAMYCTEYCHIGSGYPIRSVLNCTKDKKYPHKTPECSACD